MYGYPTTGQTLVFLFLICVFGWMIGRGCEAGCSYVRRHVDVQVKP